MDLQKIEKGVIENCKQVSEFMRRESAAFDRSRIEQKDGGFNNLVSYVDKESEKKLVSALHKLLPEAGFVTEEGTVEQAKQQEFSWIIDPLDGTTNFLHGIPHFSIAIAVEEPMPNGKREITTGLIYQPITDESYWAEKNRGAWLHDRRLRVSARRDLGESLIATGIPFFGHGDMAQWTRIFGAVAPSVAGVRRFGSATLDLAHVASGRYDAYWESGLQTWDMAAGMLMVREAGGFVTDFRGGDQVIERREVLAGNDVIHSKLHKLLASALR
jgi:myo-inositol-1(or 4)-monophosphatase